MGLFDWKHWLVLLLVVLVLFGGKRLKTLGADLGESIKGFRRSMASEPETSIGAEPPSRLGVDSEVVPTASASAPDR